MADEVEGKLIIMGPDPEVAYEAIGQLDSIGGLRVARREVEQITDAYFDSPDRRLFAAGLALRVRNLNGRELLTIKGETHVQDGVLTRDELEVEWSPDGLDEVLEALGQAGVSLGDIEAARARVLATEAVEALGFMPGSPRENQRIALTLVREGEVVAEVAVDAVKLTAGDSVVCHYEVECETQGDGDASVVHTVLDDLQSRYPDTRSWNVSKLDMGQALEVLAEEGRLPALMDGECLLPPAYEAIESLAIGPA